MILTRLSTTIRPPLGWTRIRRFQRLQRIQRGAAMASLCALLATAPAQAQLYAAAAPANSAFIRVYNNTANAGLPVQIGTAAQPALMAYSAGDYQFLPPGEVLVRAGVHQKTMSLAANHYYTAVVSREGLVPYELSGVLNRLKAVVAIFNLMPATTLSLKTADGKASVFEGVVPGQAAQREINPLKLTLAVFDQATLLGAAPPVALDRGKVFSLFVSGTAASPVMVWNDD